MTNEWFIRMTVPLLPGVAVNGAVTDPVRELVTVPCTVLAMIRFAAVEVLA